MQVIILFEKHSNYEFFYRNKGLCLELVKNFKNIKFLNLSDNNILNVPKKYQKYFYKVRKLQDLNNYFRKSTNYICISFIKKSLLNINIYRFLKLKNVSLVEIYRDGDLRDTKYFFNLELLNNLKKIYKIILININFIVYFLLYYLNILPKTDFLFHNKKNLSDQIGYCFSDSYKSSLLLIFIRFFFKKNIFFKNIYLVKSKSDDELKKKIKYKKKFIIFLDSGFDHLDRSEYDSRPNNITKKEYYTEINETFKKIKNFIFLLHPNSEIFKIKRYLKDISIAKYKTRFFLMRSKLVFFHESSSILDAIYLKKNIILLDSDSLGKYFKYRIKLYSKVYNLKIFNLSKNQNKDKIKSWIFKKDKIKYKSYFLSELKREGLKDIMKILKRININNEKT